MQKTHIEKVNQTGAVTISKTSDGVSYEIRPCAKGALKGAATGIVIGRCFGPMGVAAGALIGGTFGYVFGRDDD
jgi:hypothetical protein